MYNGGMPQHTVVKVIVIFGNGGKKYAGVGPQETINGREGNIDQCVSARGVPFAENFIGWIGQCPP